MTFFEFAAAMIGLCILLGIASFCIEICSLSERIKTWGPAYNAANFVVGPLILCSAICGAMGVLAVAGGLLELALPHL